jgi:hypothetical protein
MDQTNPTQQIGAPTAAPAVAPGIGPTPSDICSQCGAPIAADQRYCLECGQRRGEPRLPFMDGRGMQPALPPPSPPPKPRRRVSPNATLVAGIATLLIAMGVGVLIGHSGKSASSSSPPVQVVKVPGTGATAGTASASANKKIPKSKNAKTGKSKAAVQKNLAANAASGGTSTALKAAPGVTLPPPTAKVGSSCSSGTSGCQGGKFTGNFFGK